MNEKTATFSSNPNSSEVICYISYKSYNLQKFLCGNCFQNKTNPGTYVNEGLEERSFVFPSRFLSVQEKAKCLNFGGLYFTATIPKMYS